MLPLVFVLLASAVFSAEGKVYGVCSLAKELYTKHGVPAELMNQVLYIVQGESAFRTYAKNAKSHDYGLFQINKMWLKVNHKNTFLTKHLFYHSGF